MAAYGDQTVQDPSQAVAAVAQEAQAAVEDELELIGKLNDPFPMYLCLTFLLVSNKLCFLFF